MWLRSEFVQKMGGGFWEQFGLDLWSSLQIAALRSRKTPAEAELIARVRRERKCLNSAFECYLVMSLARSMTRLPGKFAEVGVYQGVTAKLIASVKGDRELHLFDTFEGLPPMSDKDAGVHRVAQYACSLESVQEYLRGQDGVYFHKGLFPDSARDVEESQYAFVHFDVDLYAGTLACLEYFYPRMVPGGVMISHDYGMLAGVQRALQEFMADKPEPIFEQPTTQAMIVKGAPVMAEWSMESTVGESSRAYSHA
ncbi:MAG TPA: TylF/MycF/NovP-related O-methyltransferase, partial [Pirellulales bacterium]|nr:TylF/MycF/NovP-related O-methyltransferase [Pirellulales bacterium]